jgi:hypothetical protein
MDKHINIWDDFCERMKIYESGVPLFEHSKDLVVKTKTIGQKLIRPVLCRNIAMEKLILSETDKLVDDWKNEKDEFDGLIYMMFLKDSGKVLPLYIGKAETIGKGNRNLSANIKNLHLNLSNFARWGDNYAYHIGDLSAAILSGHSADKINKKYLDWAKALFIKFPTSSPQLKQKVYFWTTAWNKTDIGVWKEFGSTRLTFLEYLLIGVASSLFPDLLLNREGQNRG